MEANQSRDNRRSLVDVAMGRAPADLLVRGARWVCVQSGEIVDDTDVAIKGERIAYVGSDARPAIGPDTHVLEARGRYLVPGLLDAHMHVESAMVTVTEFVRAALPHGTTGLFMDPHEIGNVFGLRGVRLMVDEAAVQPIHVWVQVPSCVPAVPALERSGAALGPVEVAEALTWPNVIGLGEMMNYEGVIGGDEQMHAELAAARQAGMVIGGHYASFDLGRAFHGYVAGGPEDDHEGTRLEDAIARVRQGMKVMLRYGSSYHDVAAQIRAVTEKGLDARHMILATDGIHAATLVQEGHMDRVVRHAIQQGVTPMQAIQMATLNPAEHFGVARDVGQIAPGRYADMLLVDDLRELVIETVIARGAVAARNGSLLIDPPFFSYPPDVRSSVQLARPLTGDDFVVPAGESGTVEVNVIGVVENQTATRHLQLPLRCVANQVILDIERDVAKVALVERHHGTGEIRIGFVHGFGFTRACAVGSTLAHDSHQLLVAGTDEPCMALAANELARVGGGQIVVREGEVLALNHLPVGGLISDQSVEIVAERMAQVLEALRACGCTLNSANMQLSLLALVVIPSLRLSTHGLVDVTRQEVIPVIAGSTDPASSNVTA